VALLKRTARFQIVTAVLLLIQVFWNVTSCRLVNSYQRSEGTYYIAGDFNVDPSSLCLKAGNVSFQNFVCSVDIYMQRASANTTIPKGKFSGRDSVFGLLQLVIPDNDSFFPLWRHSPRGAYAVPFEVRRSQIIARAHTHSHTHTHTHTHDRKPLNKRSARRKGH
jgi:hypothetical protein